MVLDHKLVAQHRRILRGFLLDPHVFGPTFPPLATPKRVFFTTLDVCCVFCVQQYIQSYDHQTPAPIEWRVTLLLLVGGSSSAETRLRTERNRKTRRPLVWRPLDVWRNDAD